MPRIVGRIRRKHPVEVEDLKFLKRHTTRRVKITVPGPFTMSQQAQNDFYPSAEAAAMDYAAAVNEEIRDLFAAGADVVQIDEPYMQARPEKAREYGLKALNRALEGITGTTAVHICFGYAAIIHERPSGLLLPAGARRLRLPPGLDRDRAVEPRLRGAREARGQEDHGRVHRPRRPRRRDAGDRSSRASGARCPSSRKEDVILAPDCGMKYLPREVAFGKMRAMVGAARLLRAELAS